jgi:hypothetical protein
MFTCVNCIGSVNIIFSLSGIVFHFLLTLAGVYLVVLPYGLSFACLL